VNFGEVYGKVLREHGIDRATSTINSVASLPIGLLDVTRQRAIHAADTGVKYKLHYTDSFAAALAIEQKATLVTSDPDFRTLGHGFSILWLKP
jgi:predicted nucleic acid-binding protein